MSTLNPATTTAAILTRVQTILGTSEWYYTTGEPRGYVPPHCAVFWRGIPEVPPPEELVEVIHEWTVRLIYTAEGDSIDAVDPLSDAWGSLRDAWKQSDNLSIGGVAQVSWFSRVARVNFTAGEAQYPGLDLTLTVIDKTPDIYT